jgi:hypothetical protein
VATEIRTDRWCDWHLTERDEKVPAEAVTLALTVSGDQPGTWHVDLCADCLGPFLNVAEVARDYGADRPSLNGTPTPTPAADEPRPCPICGKRPKFLRSHLRNIHDMTMAAVFPDEYPDARPCEDCGEPFVDLRALTQHRRKRHPAKRSRGH